MYLESKSKALLDSVVEKSPSERTMKPPSERTPGNNIMPSQFVSRKSAINDTMEHIFSFSALLIMLD